MGPTTAKLGEWAEIRVPKGFRFIDREGLTALLELDPDYLGMIAPANTLDWTLGFSFSEDGYVPVEEAKRELESLDADAMLELIRRRTEEDNQERRRRGRSEERVIGCLQPPAYDPSTNHHFVFGWLYEQVQPRSESAIYGTMILGRNGAMVATLDASADEAYAVIPTVKGLLTGFQFTPGNRYAEWRPGDKKASYGLTALITGATVAAAGKAGLLAKCGKGIAGVIAVIVAGLAAICRFLAGHTAKEKPKP
jgi:uncharacterized membrane-anchored protein